MENRYGLIKLIQENNASDPTCSENSFFELAKTCSNFAEFYNRLRSKRLNEINAEKLIPSQTAFSSYIIELFNYFLHHDNTLIVLPPVFSDIYKVSMLSISYCLNQYPQKRIIWITQDSFVGVCFSQLSQTFGSKSSFLCIRSPHELESMSDHLQSYEGTVLITTAEVLSTLLQKGDLGISTLSLVLFDHPEQLLNAHHDNYPHISYFLHRLAREIDFARPKMISIFTQLSALNPNDPVYSIQHVQKMLGEAKIAQIGQASYEQFILPLSSEIHGFLVEQDTSDLIEMLINIYRNAIHDMLKIYAQISPNLAQKDFDPRLTSSSSQTVSLNNTQSSDGFLEPLIQYLDDSSKFINDFGTCADSEFVRLVRKIHDSWIASQCKLILKCILSICSSIDIASDVGIDASIDYLEEWLRSDLKHLSKPSALSNPNSQEIRRVIEKLKQSATELKASYDEYNQKESNFEGRLKSVLMIIKSLCSQNDSDESASFGRFIIYVNQISTAETIVKQLADELPEAGVDELRDQWDSQDVFDVFIAESSQRTQILVTVAEPKTRLESFLQDHFKKQPNVQIPSVPMASFCPDDSHSMYLNQMYQPHNHGIVFIHLDMNRENDVLEHLRKPDVANIVITIKSPSKNSLKIKLDSFKTLNTYLKHLIVGSNSSQFQHSNTNSQAPIGSNISSNNSNNSYGSDISLSSKPAVPFPSSVPQPVLNPFARPSPSPKKRNLAGISTSYIEDLLNEMSESDPFYPLPNSTPQEYKVPPLTANFTTNILPPSRLGQFSNASNSSNLFPSTSSSFKQPISPMPSTTVGSILEASSSTEYPPGLPVSSDSTPTLRHLLMGQRSTGYPNGFKSDMIKPAQQEVKDPVSALHIYFSKKNLPDPSYHEEYSDGPDHNPTFKCICTLHEGQTFEGHGTRKKDAKKQAALHALEFIEGAVSHTLQSPQVLYSSISNVKTSDDKPMPKLTNPIGCVNEYYQKRGGIPPTYTEAGRGGSAHEPIFLINVSLADGSVFQGNGSTKQAAKNMAATLAAVHLGLC